MLLKAKNKDLPFIAILFILYSIAMFFFISYTPGIVGIDHYAWTDVAQKYADGHFKEALNAYWSPLMTWLMIPFVKFNWFENKEVLIINFTSGYFLILIAFKICKQFSLFGIPKFLLVLSFFLYSITIPILYYDFPDFLSAVCLIAYIAFISDEQIKTNKKYYIYTSVTAILCVFAKSFYVYFMFVHLAGLIGYYMIMNNGKRETVLVGNLLKTLLVVVLAISVWTGLLSWKYEKFVTSSAGKYNFAIITPTGSGEHMHAVLGLYSPPDPYSHHYWVDPTYFPIKEREIFKNAETLQYAWEVYKYNWKLLIYSFSYFSYFKIGVVLFGIFIFFIPAKIYKERLSMYLLSIVVILGGYSMILIEERYLSGAQILLFTFAFISTYLFFNQLAPRNTVISLMALAIVFLSFHKFDLFSYTTWKKLDGRISETTRDFEGRISKLPFMQNKRIATSPSYNEIGELTLYEVFKKTNSQNYGNLGKYDTEQKQYEDLKKYEVDYFLYFNCSKIDRNDCCVNRELYSFLKDKKPVYVDSIYGASIYAMKPYKD